MGGSEEQCNTDTHKPGGVNWTGVLKGETNHRYLSTVCVFQDILRASYIPVQGGSILTRLHVFYLHNSCVVAGRQPIISTNLNLSVCPSVCNAFSELTH